eukprot:6477273-Amphidinium_carterae.1
MQGKGRRRTLVQHCFIAASPGLRTALKHRERMCKFLHQVHDRAISNRFVQALLGKVVSGRLQHEEPHVPGSVPASV